VTTRAKVVPPVVVASLRDVREAAGWTLDDIAARVSAELGTHTTKSTISKIETGDRSVSDLFLTAVARAMRLPDSALQVSYTPGHSRLPNKSYVSASENVTISRM